MAPKILDTEGVDAAQCLINNIQDAVVGFELVNNTPMIREANEPFIETFGYPREKIVDAPLNEYIVPDWLREEATILDKRTDAGKVNYQHVRRKTSSGLREFLYRGIPYNGATVDGYAIYIDVTEVVQQEQQLKVFNRVLRHNLRTEATVISGNIERLLTTVQKTPENRKETIMAIKEAADNLESLSEEASQITQLLRDSSQSSGDVEAHSLLQESVAKAQEKYPDACITSELSDQSYIRANDQLKPAINALLENAVVHNPSETPHVRISTEHTDKGAWTDIIVDDDGPIIPETERKIITGDAEITPHQHGNGLGLWLVKLTVDCLGGDIIFEESPVGGNRVRLRVQTATKSL